MYKQFITLFGIILIALAVAPKTLGYEITGRAVDGSGEGLPYATYRIYPGDSKTAIASNTTDENGAFSQNLDSAGTYRLVLTYVGMRDAEQAVDLSKDKSLANLGDIVLPEMTTELKGVTVTAQRPLVVKEIDRIGYDVTADPATPTSSVSDILRKVPMVSVDADGTIKVNGSTNFRIFKNGRPNNSLSRNAKELLAAMPASMIKRIEVITDPGAAYDAEGTSAILNIVTNDNTAIKGVLGNAKLRYASINKYPEANLWLTSEIDKVTFSVNGGYAHLAGKMNENEQSATTFFPDGSYREELNKSKFNGDLAFFGVNGSWQIDSLNLFTAEMGGYWYNIHPTGSGFYNTFDAAGVKIGSLSYLTANPFNRYVDLDANVNFQHLTKRPGEIYTLSYSLSHTDQNNRDYTDYFDGSGINAVPYSSISSDYQLKFIEHTVQADWTRQLGIHSLDFGAKGIFRRNNSTNLNVYENVGDDMLKFRHLTDVGALYGQYSVRIGSLSLRAGLRWEFSKLKASYPDGSGDPFSTTLSDWVPSAAAAWQINDGNSMTFNYATSINRPGISYLNPAVTMSPTSESYGNPDLESARRTSFKLTYMLIKRKFNFNFSVQYAFVNNAIAPIQFLENNIIYRTFDNIGHTRELGINAFAQLTAGPKTRILFNGGVEYQYASQTGLSLGKWCPRGYVQFTQQLPWKISLEAGAFYFGNSLTNVYGYTTHSFMSGFHYNIGLRRSFLKQDRLSVNITAIRPFGPKTRMKSYIVNGDYRSESVTTSSFNHAFMIEINYRFGSLTSQVKKTQRTIDNDDLVGRKR